MPYFTDKVTLLRLLIDHLTYPIKNRSGKKSSLTNLAITEGLHLIRNWLRMLYLDTVWLLTKTDAGKVWISFLKNIFVYLSFGSKSFSSDTATIWVIFFLILWSNTEFDYIKLLSTKKTTRLIKANKRLRYQWLAVIWMISFGVQIHHELTSLERLERSQWLIINKDDVSQENAKSNLRNVKFHAKSWMNSKSIK